MIALLSSLIVIPSLIAQEDAREHGNVSFDVSPSGRTVVFASAAGDLYSHDLKTRKTTRLTQTDESENSPAFSPDGKWLVFSRSKPNGSQSLYEMPAVGGKPKPLTRGGSTLDTAPVYSPDGSKVAFVRGHRYRPYSMGGMTWDDYDACIVDRKTGTVKRITDRKFYGISSIAFAANGQALLFAADPHGSNGVFYRCPVAPGSALKTLSKAPPVWDGGAWISDLDRLGDRLAFVADRSTPFNYDIYVAREDGSAAKGLGVTSVSRYNQSPRWEPSGKSILFLAGVESNRYSRPIFSLYRVTLAGKADKILPSSAFDVK